MAGQDLALLNAMYQKMDWIEARQKVLSENIANADTPGYSAQDLKPTEFKDMLQNSTSSLSLGAAGGMSSTTLSKTNGKHLGVGGISPSTQPSKPEKSKSTYEVSPTKNSVVLEEQLMKMNENMVDHRFITNLYQKNLDMIRQSTKSQ